MQLNQDLVILNKKGQSMIGQITGLSQPLVIQEADLFLLSYFFKNNSIKDSVKQFKSSSYIKKLVPNVQAIAAEKRIQQFQQAGLFEDSKLSKAKSDINPTALETYNENVILPEYLSLSNNAGIFFNNTGFYSYSKIDQKPKYIPPSWLLLLLAFGEGKAHKLVTTEKSYLFSEDISKILETLYSHGFLIKKKSQVTNANDIQTQYASVPNDTSVKTWKDIQVDAKLIPVYFVPHMENHYPLALGVLFSALKSHKEGLLLKSFQLIPITYLSPRELLDGPYKKFGPGVWLFSNYMWSLDINLQISEAVKNHDRNNLTIHGGPSTPDYELASKDFMQTNPSVDMSVHGEGELAICQVLEKFFKSDTGSISYKKELLQLVAGISFRGDSENELNRTASRVRMKTPDIVPSPYLTGVFDIYGGRVEAAIIESNRGCPFGCTFCDWGSATNQKVTKLDLERVKQEIEWIGKSKVRVIWIADANFGLYDRDIELSQFIVDTKEKYGYPQEVVVNYTKNSTWRLVEIIKIFTAGGIISQGIISIQTTDEKTLEVINRKNIKTEKYDELVKIFYDLKLPLSTDLMLGLPGITIEGFNNDLQRYIDMDVSVKAYPTQLLPNSPMADPDYIEKYQIKVDANDFVISSFSFSEKDLVWMKGMYHIYTMADGYSLLRYVMRYLQWEHNIRAVDFLQDLMQFIKKNAWQYPQISWAVKFFNQDKSMPGGWMLFYQEISSYIDQQYGISNDSGLNTILKVSQLCMPDDTITYPLQVELAHDFSAYFLARSSQLNNKDKPLSEYPPAKFHVSDPNSMVSIDLDYMQYDSHQYFWELHSDVARPKSISEFGDA